MDIHLRRIIIWIDNTKWNQNDNLVTQEDGEKLRTIFS